MKQITRLLSTVCVATLASAVYAEDVDSATTATQENSVEQQLEALESKVKRLENRVATADSLATTTGARGEPRPSYTSIAPYIGVDSQFDGSELIVNFSSVNDDVSLLTLRKQVDDQLMEMGGQSAVDVPHLTFSGIIEAQAAYSDDFNGDSASDIDLTTAELDSYLEINHWVSGYMTMGYNNGNPQTSNAARVNNSGFELGQGYLILGNFQSSPYYSTVGQMFVPFGQYSSYMLSNSFARTLGRVQARALNVGYMDQSGGDVTPYATAYTFNGDVNVDGSGSNDKVSEYGAMIGARVAKDKFHSNVSISGISNLAESEGMQGDSDSNDADFGGFSQESSYENLDHRVPGLDIQTTTSYGATTLIAEYVTATTAFDQADMSFNGEGAKPRALNVELAYAFHWMKPSTIAATYNHSWEALGVGLPQNRYGATYTVNMWRHTALSFEVLRDQGYSESTTATAVGGAKPVNTDQLGNTYNSYIFSIDTYF